MLTGAAFLAPWSAAISVQLKRIEGRYTPMTYTQLACGAANMLLVALTVMTMIAASFRPERNPEITRAINDIAWIPFVMAFSPVMVQCLAIAVPILQHSGQRVFPRWVGYFNVWCAFLLLPAALVPFFKTGPFAWHGIFEFWLAAVVFLGMVAVMSYAVVSAIKRQEPEDADDRASWPEGGRTGHTQPVAS